MSISFFRNKSTLYPCIFLLLFLVNQLICITDVRPVMYDESWYASTGYNIANGLGIKNTIVGSGGDINFIFPLFSAVFLRIFGYNLLSIRLAAVFFGIITLISICFYLKKFKFKTYSSSLALFCFTSLTLFNTIFRFGRPECASIAFLSIGIITFCSYLSNTSSAKDIIILSISVLLSGLAHPFALLPYCIMGIILIINAFQKRNFKQEYPNLLILLLSGIIVILTLFILADNNAGVTERFSVSNIKNSVPVYIKGIFLSRHAITSITVVSIIVYELLFTHNQFIKYLAITGLATFIIFPIIFTTDLMMVGLGLDYTAIIALFTFPQFIEDISNRIKTTKIVLILTTCFLLANLGLSYYYNFFVKYEKANSVLSKDINKEIPQQAIVFGPIRLWPFAMETMYISDHYRLELPDFDSLDYIITSSQDKDRYPSYNKYKPYLMEENIVYSKETRQYGTVNIYKCK